MEFLVNWIASTPTFAVPLMLAAIGLIINERAGVMNLGAEGIMLGGALAAVAGYLSFGNAVFLGIVTAILAGVVISALFAFFVVVLRANQVVTGISIVFFGAGLTGLVGQPWTDKPIAGIDPLDLGVLTDIPWLGPILFGQDIVVYLSAILVFVTWQVLYRSNFGMKLRAVGENPQAADAAGVNVEFYRFVAVLIGGAFLGLAGAYLSLAASKIWVIEMTNGRGWIAVGLVIFARWRPGRAIIGAIIFGGIEALIPRVQAAGWDVPQYYMFMLPYLATLAVLIYVGATSKDRSGAPEALGLPFIREDRH